MISQNKVDFVDLKEKLIVQGQSTGGVRFQSKQDAAIISELIEIIQSFDERCNHDQDCYAFTNCVCGYNEFISETTACLQKLINKG